MATHGSGSAFPTAALVCAMRAEATRLGIDPDLGEPDMLAESFAGDLGRAFLNAFRAAGGSIIHRTNYYNAAMLQAVQSGCTQVLLLGSGLDTRAWRLRRFSAFLNCGSGLPLFGFLNFPLYNHKSAAQLQSAHFGSPIFFKKRG